MTFGWVRNVSKIFFGRQPWNADAEFDYYCVSDEVLMAHHARHEKRIREAFFDGLITLRAFGLLDKQLMAGRTLLDLGCGEGNVVWAATALGTSETVGVDAVPKQCWAAACHAAGRGDVRFLIGGVTDLPFEDETFDIVLAHLLLHHVAPIERVLEEVFRVLRPGGVFTAMEPSPFTGLLVHEVTSANEAPIPSKTVLDAGRRLGFVDMASTHWWPRLETSRLGALSPGYIVRMTRESGSDAHGPSAVRYRRHLEGTRLPGLSLDPGCSFAALAKMQIDEIAGRARALGLLPEELVATVAAEER
jgi:ubiquinone/menaquinone biosynthesis C-methylase UbiE